MITIPATRPNGIPHVIRVSPHIADPQRIFVGMGTPRGLVFDIGQARELAQELNILADVLEAEVSQPSGLLVQDL